MTGVTIDHMVSLILLITVLMASMIAYSQIISGAVNYQQNHQTSMEADELANTLLLSPGNPVNWGGGDTPLAIGLQDPTTEGYSLSGFSLQRLSSAISPLVYYSKTGFWYSNNSVGVNGAWLAPVNNIVNYSAVTKLLGINGSYAFRLAVTPTLNVSIAEANLNPLKLKVQVSGSGFALGGASLDYFLFRAIPQGGQYPSLQTFSGTNQTDSNDSALLVFPSVDGSQYAYSAVVYARLSGLTGVGFCSRNSIMNNKIVPLIGDFKSGTVLLAHSWDLHNFPLPTDLYFNTTFLTLTQDLELREIQGGVHSSGLVQSGSGKLYAQVQIPTGNAGVFVVAYESTSGLGIVMMPWGVSPLGFSIIFGGDPGNTGWVATELRQVTVNKISYQVKLSIWSTKGFQPWRFYP